MNKRKLFFLLTAAVLFALTACEGSFTDPGAGTANDGIGPYDSSVHGLGGSGGGTGGGVGGGGGGSSVPASLFGKWYKWNGEEEDWTNKTPAFEIFKDEIFSENQIKIGYSTSDFLSSSKLKAASGTIVYGISMSGYEYETGRFSYTISSGIMTVSNPSAMSFLSNVW
jgi:hypothetical protein